MVVFVVPFTESFVNPFSSFSFCFSPQQASESVKVHHHFPHKVVVEIVDELLSCVVVCKFECVACGVVGYVVDEVIVFVEGLECCFDCCFYPFFVFFIDVYGVEGSPEF